MTKYFRHPAVLIAILVPIAAVLLAATQQRGAQVVVRVTGLDYALKAPDSVRADQLIFEFENRGQHDHELFVGLLRPGVAATDIVAAHQKGVNFRQLHNVYLDGAMPGMLYATPGTDSPARLTLPGVRGRSYILLCQLRDTIGAPSHAVLGMFKVIHVK